MLDNVRPLPPFSQLSLSLKVGLLTITSQITITPDDPDHQLNIVLNLAQPFIISFYHNHTNTLKVINRGKFQNNKSYQYQPFITV